MTDLSLYPIPVEISDVVGNYFPRVYAYIDQPQVLAHLVHTIVGLAEYYLDKRPSTPDDIKLVPIHFKWMSEYYTLDELERLFLSIQLCETVRRYAGEFTMLLQDIRDYQITYDREPTLTMAGTMDHILLG